MLAGIIHMLAGIIYMLAGIIYMLAGIMLIWLSMTECGGMIGWGMD